MAVARRLLVLLVLVAAACSGQTRYRHHEYERRDGVVVVDRTVEGSTESKGYHAGYYYPVRYQMLYTGWPQGYCGYGPPTIYDNRVPCYTWGRRHVWPTRYR